MQTIPLLMNVPSEVEDEFAENDMPLHDSDGYVISCSNDWFPLLFEHCKEQGIEPGFSNSIMVAVYGY